MSASAIPQEDRRRAERRAGPNEKATPSQNSMSDMPAGSYGRFAAMVGTSTLVGFGAMYFNTYQLDHIYFSWNRLFMALIMGGVMTAVMMLFMWKMYPSRRANYAVLTVAAALLLIGIYTARTQATVQDQDWMKAMIPHHSIAILTSERADLTDPRVQKLAQQIIESQRKEIDEMKSLLQEGSTAMR